MDNNIKKESVNPNNNDMKNISEKSSNEVIKKQIVDDRTDELYFGNKKIKIGDSLLRRPAFPWEDASIFEKQESDKNISTIKDNYKKTQKEEKYTVDSKNSLEVYKPKYKSDPDKYITVKLEPVKNLVKGTPLANRYYTPDVMGEYKTGNSDKESVKREVAQRLKAAGLSKGQVAGIMGNMQSESNFDPDAEYMDSNDMPSVGLVQFNGGSYVGAKTFQGMFDVIGRTVESQINYLLNTPKCKKFISRSHPYPNDPKECCFLFAQIFEGCSICTSRQLFSGEGGQKRTAAAVGFYEKFNDSSSHLYWETLSSNISSNSNQSISGNEFVYRINPFSIRFYSKGNGRWSVKDLVNEAKEKFKINNAINLSFYSPSGKWDPPYKDDTFADYTMYHKNLMWIDSSGIHIKKFSSNESAPRNAKYIIGSTPMAILNGVPQSLSLEGRQADKAERTAVGVTNDGQAIIYVCTSKDIIQARDSMMKITGIKDALFLDGGGSTFLMKDNKFLVKNIDMRRKLPTILTW